MKPDVKTYYPDEDELYRVLFLEETLHPISTIILMDLLGNRCTIDIAYNGEIGLKLIAERGYDLVVTGLMLYKASGYDVLDITKATEETKHIKFIVHSGLQNKSDRKKAKELGCDDYLDANAVNTKKFVKAIYKQLGIKKTDKKSNK